MLLSWRVAIAARIGEVGPRARPKKELFKKIKKKFTRESTKLKKANEQNLLRGGGGERGREEASTTDTEG